MMEGQSVDLGQSAGGAVVGNGVEVVKRKRGRPPRVQANKPVAKKSKEEDGDEDVCFICFDGGSLVLCDRRGCPKAYHPACIKRDEAFFRSKAKWNCGWHICSMCEKTAHHMCYTCTYSLCKGCIRKADYVCVRGDKGFCTVCMKTIMLIENKDAAAKVDFDDKTSWEYLFKVYWVYLKGKLSLTLDELTQAQNPWKISSTIASIEPTGYISASGRRSITSELSFGNMEANESKRRKTDEQTNGLSKESPSMDGPKEWASKELLDFVAHMKNGDTSVLSQFDVQALLLEYIKRNNLRDPRKKTQIICDLRLKNLFGKARVGHIEMLKLLEFHFLLKEDSQKKTISSTAKPGKTGCKTDNINENKITNNNNMVVVANKERRNHRKGEKRITQNKLDEYAAIDVHNMSLIYLRRNLVESLIEDREKFHEKVVGSIVQIRISGSDQKDDMYRLVHVVGTIKVDVPYKVGDKSVDVMLEVSNLDKKETVSIDTISNQELSEDECRRLRESVRCGLVRSFTVGEIQEKAIALQSVLLDGRLETEMLRLNQLRDRASENGQKKSVRECVQKLKRLKTPEERERRLREIPEVHSDPKMNPHYESDDTEEYFNNEQVNSPGEHMKPKFPWANDTNRTTSEKQPESKTLNDQLQDSGVITYPNLEEDTRKPNTGKGMAGLSGSGTPHIEAYCNWSTVTKPNPEAAVSSSLSNNNDDMWHYRDPSGNVQGPFSLVQLQQWSTSGYFPADMRIWASQEADLLLLNKVLHEQFHNYTGLWPENVARNNKVENQIEIVNVCSAVPTSTIPATPVALNSVNLEKLDDNLKTNPPSVAPLAKTNESTERLNTRNVPDINQHVSSVPTVADAAPMDLHLPNSLLKMESHENKSVQNSGDKEQSKHCDPPSVASLAKTNVSTEPLITRNMPDINQLVVQDSGNPPSWNTALSLVAGGDQLPETANEWTIKEWSSSHVPMVSSLDHQVATANSSMDQLNNMPTWQGLGETIEFSTLAEESVSDLLAEVDAMESRNDLSSPTSRRNSFLEDLFNGSIDDFSPTGDEGTRSDGFSSSTDIQLSHQSTSLPFSFGVATKPTCAVSIIPQTTNSDNTGFKWAELGGSELLPRQDMIDLNDSTRAEADEVERDNQIEEVKKHKFKEKERVKGQVTETKLIRGFQEAKEEQGEFIEPEVAPPPPPSSPPPPPPPPPPPSPPPPLSLPSPPPPPLPLSLPPPPSSLPPLLPLPPTPPQQTMGLDVIDSRRSGSGRPSHGTTSTGRVHTHTNASLSGSVARDSHHRRSSGGGDRYNSNSPRERGHHVEDSGYNRSSRSTWSRQSSFGASSGSGSGYSRPPSKGQRVCKFYESGRCKKGSACNYLHPQDR